MLTITRTSSPKDYPPSKLISNKPAGVSGTSRTKLRFLCCVVALSGLALLAFGARQLVALSKEAATPANPQRQPSALLHQTTENPIPPQDEPTERIEFVVIKVTPFGFEPCEIERSRNPFVLAVHNHSGIAELSLRLNRVNSERLHEIQMRRGRKRWQLPLNLPPGDYVLSEASQLEWLCRIKLTS